MSSSESKIIEIGINVFKRNCQFIKVKKKYYEISTIYECVEKLSMIIGCNYNIKYDFTYKKSRIGHTLQGLLYPRNQPCNSQIHMHMISRRSNFIFNDPVFIYKFVCPIYNGTLCMINN